MIQLRHLIKKDQEKQIIDDLSLEIGEGLTFLTGSSGSGKSTLLRMIAGIDSDYSGEIRVAGNKMEQLNASQKSYVANNVIGFIWQDYRLLDDLTVEENIRLPLYLKKQSAVDINKVMADLNILSLAKQPVKDLSGGQKQRVAIARELMKNPDIILADEPTSALDGETSKQLMAVFRELAKTRTVVVVTHDQSNIKPNDRIIEIAKGQVIASNQEQENAINPKVVIKKNPVVSWSGLVNLLKTNFLRHPGRLAIAILTLILGTSLLVTSMGDNVESSSQGAFDEIFDMYGPGVLDIGLYGSFTGASGTGDESEEGPNTDVTQDIRSLYAKYQQDPRVDFVAYTQAFTEIEVTLDSQKYQITDSGNVPVINQLIAGEMSTGKGNEVVVPESFAEQSGLKPEELLGKSLDFSGSIVNWQGNEPIFENTQTTAKIVGVMDTTMVMVYEGEKQEFVIEDSFLFSQSALTSLLEAIDKEVTELSFVVRAKTPKEMIAIRDELNSEGIVPLGNFEVIEDLVRIGDQSNTQSNVVNRVMVAVVFVLVGSVSLFSAIMRKKEYAIFKLSGYDAKNLTFLTIGESIVQGVVALGLVFILSPGINVLGTKVFNQNIMTSDTINIVASMMLLLVFMNWLITEVVCRQTTVMKAFKVGKK